MKKLIIFLLIFSINTYLMAKIDSVVVTGDVQMNWINMNNGFDKTSTRLLSGGTKLYDDLDEYAYTYFALCFNFYVMDNISFNFGFDKKDVLWGSHNNYFNADHYQTLGEFFGSPTPNADGNFKGLKIDNLNIKATEIMSGYGQFIGGRQFYAGTVYEETGEFSAINQDLFLYITSDGLVWTLNYGFLLPDPKIKSELFAFKLNDNSATLYGSSGGLLWDRAYGDGDEDLYGLITRVTFGDNYFKNYLLYLHKGGEALISGENNEDGYNRVAIIGFSYMNPKFYSPYLKISAEFGYEFGDKSVGTYYSLDNNLNWAQNSFYGIAKYSSYIYRLGAVYKRDRWAGALFNVGGSGDNPSTPDRDTGFYGFNEQLHFRVMGVDYSGYGEIFSATPYTHNFALGSPAVRANGKN